jgi:hypothetical protein
MGNSMHVKKGLKQRTDYPHRHTRIRVHRRLGLTDFIPFDRPYWVFFQDHIIKNRLKRANHEMKGFDRKKTGLNIPYWIESVFSADLQFEDPD